jgi:Immunity protein 22
MRTEISHFWVGAFKNEHEFGNFFGETENYYEDEREIDEKYISEFAKSQHENYYDHDFFEYGFENEEISFEERFSKYSYSEQWLAELKNRIEQKQLTFKINSIAFITKAEIANPSSVKENDFELIYMGEIEYEI